MKKIKVGFILGSGLDEGTETILYETKEELAECGFDSIREWLWYLIDIPGAVECYDGETIHISSTDTYEILEDNYKQ